MAGNDKRFCKRCLLKDFDREAYFQTVQEYLDSLVPEDKADSGLYQQRLNICTQCEKLVNGMCRVCGCFVEVRAAKKAQYCPDTKKMW